MLLHGLGTGPGGWRPQIEAFGASRAVIAPWLNFDDRFTVGREASRILDGPETAGAVDFCGLSLGALVALRIGLDEPGRVRRLAVCAGFAALPGWLRALQLALGGATAVVPSRFLRGQLVAAVPEQGRETARRETSRLDRRTIRRVFREGRRFDVRDELARLTMPVLVLVGEDDRANRRLSRELAEQISGAELEVIPGAGHVANLDAPDAFNEALRRFFDAG